LRVEEAIGEAYKRWGDKAAMRRNNQSKPVRFEVGYFEQMGERILFHVFGSGLTVEEAFKDADGHEFGDIMRPENIC
jgi:hypothetical protein